MIDMGQADSTLYRTQKKVSKMAWLYALNCAVKNKGYESIMDVPDDKIDEVHADARRIQAEAENK